MREEEHESLPSREQAHAVAAGSVAADSVDPGSVASGSESLSLIAPELEKYRQYLLAIALAEMPQDLAGKVGASDVVQDALFKGCQSLTQFEGETSQQLAGWLRQILLNQLTNQVRAFRAEKRDVSREQTTSGFSTVGREPSPSAQLARREEFERFQLALAHLPAELRAVIRLRHEEDLTFAQIAQRLGRSEETARRRWAEAIQQLQTELKKYEQRSR